MEVDRDDARIKLFYELVELDEWVSTPCRGALTEMEAEKALLDPFVEVGQSTPYCGWFGWATPQMRNTSSARHVDRRRP